MKANICMPKITKEVDRAVRKATRLIPCDDWPVPRVDDEVVAELAAAVAVAVPVVADIWCGRSIEAIET